MASSFDTWLHNLNSKQRAQAYRDVAEQLAAISARRRAFLLWCHLLVPRLELSLIRGASLAKLATGFTALLRGRSHALCRRH